MDVIDAGVVVGAARNGVPPRAAGIGVMLAGGTAALALAGPRALRLVNR
ncbi:hypothetical protein [Gordonia sp. ABSL49_1]|nr:hypothetical protein [Gordonia sp. ABSL49_1]MCH5645352.1 hypothetical protein [Gordonia sp. ABSL49_1]